MSWKITKNTNREKIEKWTNEWLTGQIVLRGSNNAWLVLGKVWEEQLGGFMNEIYNPPAELFTRYNEAKDNYDKLKTKIQKIVKGSI